ncbi:GNAT family acetyltransferase [Psychrobacter pygoscelis]|uniref:GNAT family acetyltransferase n=1 Tax=Psychrobacter pygoscelis TaxID=2488563 RepID=UPI00103BF19D|nr:GNAT family acetyltransferase [Psychrobacter pygoscelis]
MTIRPFKEPDRQAIIQLWQDCDLTRPWNDPDKDISRKMAFQPELFLVAEDKEQVIASAMAGYDGHRGSVYYLAVSPDYQARGIGKQLMSEIEDRLIKLGCPKLNIVVRSSNDKVLEFYRKLDYASDDVVSLGKRLIADKD